MASALDPSAIQVPQEGQTFAYADDMSESAPRTAEDFVTGSTSDIATRAVPVLLSDDAGPPAATALTGSEPASAPPRPIMDATAEQPTAIDPATARIYSASGHQTAPAARPPVSALAKRTGSLLALFSNNRTEPARKALTPPTPADNGSARAELWSAPSDAPGKQKRPVIASANASGLPGVDRDRALSPTASTPDERTSEPIRLASAAGLARLAPNGLRVQTDGVDVKCLKPALVGVLKKVERHYGREVVVTSGYRSPSRNKRASGSSNSLHIYCSAADIQIEGVSKWQLAEYLRSMPGRGGVGTYCHTESVHIDIGPKRDWNWRCRRKK